MFQKHAIFTLPHFCLIYNCKNIIQEKTCYKNTGHPKCIDHDKYAETVSKFTGNWNRVICFSQNVFNGTGSFQEKLHIIQYWSFNKFSNEAFINDLQNTFFNLTWRNSREITSQSWLRNKFLNSKNKTDKKYITSKINIALVLTKQSKNYLAKLIRLI